MNENAVFKLSYGLFYLGSEHDGKRNICVVNTVAQVTQEPIRISVTVLKSNYTASLINSSKKFSVSVMGANIELDDVAHFGQQSGRDIDKLDGFDSSVLKTDKLSNPLFVRGCIAVFAGKVIETIDLGTHFLFIADLADAEIIADEAPITYNDYRAMKAAKQSGTSLKPEAQKKEAVYQCTVCHYIYDGEIPFEELPEDYVCPVCKKPKSFFVKI